MKGYCVIFLALVFLMLFNQDPTIAIVGILVIGGIYLLVRYKFGRFFGRRRGMYEANNGRIGSESDLLTYLIYRDYLNNNGVFTKNGSVNYPNITGENLEELYGNTEEKFDYERQILESFDKIK